MAHVSKWEFARQVRERCGRSSHHHTGEHSWLVNLSPPNVPPVRNDGLIMGLIADLIKGKQWVFHTPWSWDRLFLWVRVCCTGFFFVDERHFSHQLSNPRLDLLRQLAPEMLPVAAGGCALPLSCLYFLDQRFTQGWHDLALNQGAAKPWWNHQYLES